MSTPWLPAWDGASYAANTGHHRRLDADFLATFTLAPDARVLDLGCGAGDFTAVLAGLVPDGHVVGVDPQPSMIEQAVAVARPNQSFVLGTAQDLAPALAAAEERGPFDAVVSRATLHWAPLADHPRVLAHVAALLRPGGLLRVDAGGGDNIAEVVAYLDAVAARHGGPAAPWAFAQAGQWLDLLHAAGLTDADGWVRLVAQRRPFTRDELIGWLTSQCLFAYEHAMEPGAAAAFHDDALAGVDALRRADGSYDVTFTRLDVRAHRPA